MRLLDKDGRPVHLASELQDAGTDKLTTFRAGKELRHAEENTPEELGFKVQPYLVKLGICRFEYDLKTLEAEYYVRAPAQAAAMLADQAWQRWEKDFAGLHGHRYPDTKEEQLVQKIDDQEFMDKWKFVRKLERGVKMQYGGSYKNPTVFVHWPDGRPDLRFEVSQGKIVSTGVGTGAAKLL